MSRCKGCGAEIIWIKTGFGKSIPCDPEQIVYRKDSQGALNVVTPNGEVLRAERSTDPNTATGIGYISHFATCPQADSFRKKKERAEE